MSLCFLVFLSVLSHAEYRVFTLKITDIEAKTERYETTVLDHIQYQDYYPLRSTEVIEIWDTWKCMGRTGDFRDFCRNPRSDEPQTPTGPSYLKEPQPNP